MQAPTPRRAPRARRFVGIGAAALLAVPTALIATAPAHAAEPGSETFTSATATDWIVPAGVREVTITAVGGSGGNAAGQHAGTGGLGASVESVRTVEPGDVLTIWAGQAGGNAGGDRLTSGAGGAGFTAGGNGGYSGGSLSRPGAGGGGSSAVSVDGTVAVIAGGGGGGGGRGADAIEFLGRDACRGGAGGNAGAAGAVSWSNSASWCSVQQGGTAGADATLAGANASDVPQVPFVNVNEALGGSGGGGAGAAGAGVLSTSGLRNAGGGGGGGGASLGDTVGLAAAAGNGSVTVDFETAYVTTLDVTSDPSSSVIGENVTFTAVVENTETDATPTGEVSFSFDGVGVFTAPLVATSTPGVAEATLERASTSVGTQWIDSDYIPAAGSPFAESFWSVAHIVERGDTVTEILGMEPADPTYVESVRATAKVSVVAPAVAPLDGVVSFRYGVQELGVSVVDPATGEASVTFPAIFFGDEELTAEYLYDSRLNASEDSITLTTSATSSTTTLKAGAAQVAKGGAVKLDATVSAYAVHGDWTPEQEDPNFQGAGGPLAPLVQPTGVVRFLAGDRVLGEVPLGANRTASLTTTDLAVGSHEIVAHFVSSVPEITSSKSAPVKVTVSASSAIASTGVDGTLLGGAGALAALFIAVGAFMVIRRRRAEA